MRGIWPRRRRDPTRRSPLELERSAGRAQARGGLAAAAAFLQRAVALTGDPAAPGRRALAAAEASLQAGAFDVARRLLATAEVGPLDELRRARLDLLRAEAAYSETAAATLLPCCCGPRRRSSRSTRSSRARPISTRGARRCSPGGSRAPRGLHDVSRARPGRAAGRPSRRVRRICCWTASRCAFTDGRAAAAPVLERAASGFAGRRSRSRRSCAGGGWRRRRPSMVWDYETCLAVATRGVQLARDAGALACSRSASTCWPRRWRWAESSGARRCWSARPTPSPRRRAPGSRPTARSCSPAFRAARPRRRR